MQNGSRAKLRDSASYSQSIHLARQIGNERKATGVRETQSDMGNIGYAITLPPLMIFTVYHVHLARAQGIEMANKL